tara:strand:- start:526 stop:1341 length:816 start_codon:yes stop_codon:yes gene_type:complete
MTETGLMRPAPKSRLNLRNITLCAVSSTNVEATLKAMRTCMAYAEFADAILCTDASPPIEQSDPGPSIRVVEIERLTSAHEYSFFMLQRLADHITTDHCLTVQWDGHIIDPDRWQAEFLDYDYIGASWPQFDDGNDVGNGGFSLRSRRLMELCREPDFVAHHPEDVAIGRTNRAWLESRGMRFAPASLADDFAAERAGSPAKSFGYHGVFLMPKVLGADRFWRIYRTLDARSSMWRDLGTIIKALRSGDNLTLRSLELFFSRISDSVSRRL